MRVLAVANFPVDAAATRFRVCQFVEPLRERGIEITVSPFLNNEQFHRMYKTRGRIRKASGLIPPLVRRLLQVREFAGYQLLFVQREAMFFGPEVFEWLVHEINGLPFILDLDDSTYVEYRSPKYGRLGNALKFFGKTDRLIKRASVVICGNRFVAEYVKSKGTQAVIIPTVVDTNIFKPAEKQNEIPVIGWIGTHSTFPFLESIFPVLSRLAEKHRFVVRLVGTGEDKVDISGVKIQNLPWSLDREVEDFRAIDIGLYPIFPIGSADETWLKGKSGFKAIQYMSVGIPFVMSPVGVCAEIGVSEETHFNAETPNDWYNALDRLLSDAGLRRSMGEKGRSHALENYTVEKWSAALADVLFSAAKKTG